MIRRLFQRRPFARCTLDELRVIYGALDVVRTFARRSPDGENPDGLGPHVLRELEREARRRGALDYVRADDLN